MRSVDKMDSIAKEQVSAVHFVAETIRSKSRSGELVSGQEIFQELLDRRLLEGEGDGIRNLCDAIMERTLEENDDLVKLHAAGAEPYFISSQWMSTSYATILLQKKADPLLLIAEIVRHNSAIYPRPVPLGAFEDSPFDLTKEEILHALSLMAGKNEYRDIQQTISSIGTVFLYSTLHLEQGHASMLAEWIDVGQANNP